MKLKSQFCKIASSDDYSDNIKPSIKAFQKVIEKFKITESDTVYFFEDSLENLNVAKKLHWKTILITNNNKKYKNVDYIFPNIETAIFHFCKK